MASQRIIFGSDVRGSTIDSTGNIYRTTRALNIDPIDPFISFRWHDVGQIKTIVTNYMLIGAAVDDRYRTLIAESRSYPKNGRFYQAPSVSIGGIIGRDTLVSRGFEFFPLPKSAQILLGDTMQVRSISDDVFPNPSFSEQDISSVFYDTVTNRLVNFPDPVDLREHRPLGLEVHQTSYAWSLPHADDFILFNYRFTNVSNRNIRRAFLNVELRGNLFTRGSSGLDGISGFLREKPSFTIRESTCDYTTDMKVAWSAHFDAQPNPVTQELDGLSATAVMGVRLLRPDNSTLTMSYNWRWSDDVFTYRFSPRKQGTDSRPFRNFASGELAHNFGDRDAYYEMSSGEIDYDQLLTGVGHESDNWLPPPDFADSVARGYVASSSLSIGPFDLAPGESIPFTFAWVGGENFHTSPTNVQDNWDPFNPQPYIDNLDFSELIKNATWAGWVYDNPGVDTDGDGYRGEFRVCVNDTKAITDTTFVVDNNAVPPETTFAVDTITFITDADTTYFKGDGIPDFRAAAPPPAPDMRINPSYSKLEIEWNGIESETTPDIFTNELDFEGYRVYVGLTPRRSDMALISSFDIEDYTQFFQVSRLFKDDAWTVVRKPFSKREAQIAYAKGSSRYNPLVNGIDNPLQLGDSVFYFASQDYNQSNLKDLTAIHKIYPDEPKPHTLDLGKAFTEDTWYTDTLTGATVFYQGGELTPDGKRFKFYEYRLILDNLLPSQPYYVAVTAFDYGSPGSDLGFLETSPSKVAVEALAQDKIDSTIPDGLNVIVYPNPYRINGNYRADGFEGRGREDFADERNRLIHFTNLPPQCDIKIYSLDGDLIRQIIHDKPAGDPSSMHDTWDVISRNLQVVVSGIYYFVIETPDGRTQLGKIVLIM